MVWMWTVPHQFMSCLEMLRNPWDTGSSGCMRPTGWGSWGLQSSQSPTHTSLAVWSCSIPSCLGVFTYMDKANPASISYHPWWTASLNRESESILKLLCWGSGHSNETSNTILHQNVLQLLGADIEEMSMSPGINARGLTLKLPARI